MNIETSYPTQNNIDAIGMKKNEYEDLKILEKSKYHSWRFIYDGKLKKKVVYASYSRRDIAFVEEVYNLNMEKVSNSFTLKEEINKSGVICVFGNL